jgi:hypothetical protein
MGTPVEDPNGWANTGLEMKLLCPVSFLDSRLRGSDEEIALLATC